MPQWITQAVSSAVEHWPRLQFDATLKVTALLLLAIAASSALRRASAAARHLVWLGALTGCLVLLPVFSLFIPNWNVLPAWVAATPARSPDAPAPAQSELADSVQPAARHRQPGVRSEDALIAQAGAASEYELASDGAERPAALAAVAAAPGLQTGVERPASVSWAPLIMSLWAVGFAVALARIGLATIKLGLLARQSRPFASGRMAQLLAELRKQLGIRTPVALLAGSNTAMPITWGVLPKILLPAQAIDWPRERLRMVLLHELAHVKRADALTHLLAELARAASWFNPLVWLAIAQLEVECEMACDDLVVTRSGRKASGYAQALLEIHRTLVARSSSAMTIAMARRSGLHRRVLAILDTTRDRRPVRPATQVAFWSALVVLVGVLAPVHSASVALAQSLGGTTSPAVTAPSLLTQAGGSAVMAPENLLPNTTKAFVTSPSVELLEEAWRKTQIGEMLQDPTMKPFMDSLQKQLEVEWTKTHQKLGISWEDLKKVPSGETAMGFIAYSDKDAVTAIVADVTGKQPQAKELFAKIDKNLAAQKAARSQRNVQGTTVVVLDVPKQGDIAAHQVSYALKGDLLVAADNVKVLEGILGRAANANDRLGAVAGFDASMKRVQIDAGSLAPQARFYLDPFGYADLSRVASTRPRKKGTDMVKILKKEGFTAVQGIGGYVNVSLPPYEILYRAYVYAPGAAEAGKKFTLGARMMELPNGGEFEPPAWVPADVSRFGAMNLKVANSFDYSKTLINTYVGDPVYDDVLKELRDDPNGPRIDLRAELIAHLADRVWLISDMKEPITKDSERILMAIDTTDVDKVTAAIDKMYRKDPDAKAHKVNGITAYELIDADLRQGVAVAFGQLLMSSHFDLLVKVLSAPPGAPKLADSADFKRVTAETQKLQLPNQSVRLFTRLDEALHESYESMRIGKLPESQSILGKILNSGLGDNKPDTVRKQNIDGSKAPDYAKVRGSLGPGGITVTTEDQGWAVTGFLLRKKAE